MSALSKKVPSSLRALGRRALPQDIVVTGHRYVLQRIFKNDFFAITSMYECQGHRVVLKVGRQVSFMLIPLAWIGRWLANREWAALTRLQDIAGIPKPIARWERTGVIREFAEGHPLEKGEHVPDDFHERLAKLIQKIHERDMAYVDLEKCENVLVGDDGRPHLFDFQICWHWSKRWGGELWPMRALRRWFQHGDLYHLRKLKRRTRRDQMSAEELASSYRKPWYVRLHRTLTFPFLWCRRKILNRIDPRRDGHERGHVHDGESMNTL